MRKNILIVVLVIISMTLGVFLVLEKKKSSILLDEVEGYSDLLGEFESLTGIYIRR